MGEHRPTLKGNPLPHQVSPHKEKGPISPPRRWEPPEGQQGAVQSPVLGTLGTGCGIQPGSPWGPGGQWRVTVSWWEHMRTQGLWGVLHGDLDVMLGTGSGGGIVGQGGTRGTSNLSRRGILPLVYLSITPQEGVSQDTASRGRNPSPVCAGDPGRGPPTHPTGKGPHHFPWHCPTRKESHCPTKHHPTEKSPSPIPAPPHGSGFPSPTLPQWGRAAHGAAPDPKTGARGTGGHLALLSTGTQGNPTAHSQP